MAYAIELRKIAGASRGGLTVDTLDELMEITDKEATDEGETDEGNDENDGKMYRVKITVKRYADTNSKAKNGFDTYKYYVVGLRIDGADYTAKLAIGTKDGETYYDHALTEIEKSNLINQIDSVERRVYDDKAAISDVKDKRLVSIMQTNSSKVVDENGEPLVLYHFTSADNIDAFDHEHDSGKHGDILGRRFYFTPLSDSSFGKELGGTRIDVFINMKNPYNASKPLSSEIVGNEELMKSLFGEQWKENHYVHGQCGKHCDDAM